MNATNNTDFQIWEMAQKWGKNPEVSLERLLRPEPFHMIAEEVIQGGMVNDHALLMMTKANTILTAFAENLDEHMKNHLDAWVAFNERWHLGEVRFSPEDQTFLLEIRAVRNHLAQNVALIHECVVRNFPESAGIIAADKTRKNGNLWVEYLLETQQNPNLMGMAYEESIDDYYYFLSPEDGVPDPGSIALHQPLVEDAIEAVAELTSKVNFAITQCCHVVNFINYQGLVIEMREEYLDPNEYKQNLDSLNVPNGGEGLFVLNRWNEIVYRQKRYPLGINIPRSYPSLPGVTFADDSMLPYRLLRLASNPSNEMKKALNTLMKYGQSLSYSGKNLENWKLCASKLPEYMKARKVIWNWYKKRVRTVSDKSFEKAISTVLDCYELYDYDHEDISVFIADQTVVSNMQRKGDELPKTSKGYKDKMTAIKELSPQLEELGLKIVPIDSFVVDSTKEYLESTEPSPGLIQILQKQLDEIGGYDDFMRGFEEGMDDAKEMVEKVKLKKATDQKMIGTATEEALASNSYSQQFEQSEKLQKWKDTDLYRGFMEKLGGGPECSVIDIAKCQGKQVYSLEHEQMMEAEKREGKKPTKIKNYITNSTAKNNGNLIVKENDLQPVKGYNVLTKEKAIIKAFTEACRKAFKETKINSPEITEAVNKLKNAKKFNTDIDGAFKLHLKKLDLSAKDIKFFSEKAKNYEGSREPTRAAKYSAEAVAIIFCENHNNGQ